MTKKIGEMGKEELAETIFGIDNSQSFEEVSFSVFNFQYQNCPVYKKFCDILHKTPGNVHTLEDIPFMPSDFFRFHSVTCLSEEAELCFHSSTTTGAVPAKHIVAYSRIYEESIKRNFKIFFGDPSQYCILALLPGYTERSNSSLVYMVDKLMEWSGHEKCGFYLYEYDKLKDVLNELMKIKNKILLIGVSHALLDFAENNLLKLTNTIIMETGGMKGKRKELVLSELHCRLKNAFGVREIHSEYGMTELLSQAYSVKNGKFMTPPWMKVFFREINDPFTSVSPGKTGAINVIDLANVFSCSFIATYDMGKQNADYTFEVLGRMDNSEIRGCNLMVT